MIELSENFDEFLNHKESLLSGLRSLGIEVSADNISEGVFGAISSTSGIAFGTDPTTDKSYLQSRNFVSGTTGWQILSDGSAQFAAITITGGTIRYGKSSFTDSVNAGYYLGAEGIYFGAAADASKLKYTISSAALDFIGTITASTITGSLIKTAASGTRIEMTSGGDAFFPNRLLYYQDANLVGTMFSTVATLSFQTQTTGQAITFSNLIDGLAMTIFGNLIVCNQSITMTAGKTVDGVDISVFASAVIGHVADPNAHHSSTSAPAAFGFKVLAAPPGAAASYTGYMYYDTTQIDLVFSNGSDWYKVTAVAI